MIYYLSTYDLMWHIIYHTKVISRAEHKMNCLIREQAKLPGEPSPRKARKIESTYLKNIGRITIALEDGEQSYGTGCLISKNFIITCAHIFMPPQALKPVSPKNVYFLKAQHGVGKEQNFFIVKSIYIPQNFLELKKKNDANRLNFDYALLFVVSQFHQEEKHLTNDYMHLQPKENIDFQEVINRQQQIEIYGYPHTYQKSQRPIKKFFMYGNRTHKIKYHDKSQDLLSYKLSTEQGQSGSPIVMKFHGVETIIGIHIGNKQKTSNFGLLLTKILLIQIKKWAEAIILSYKNELSISSFSISSSSTNHSIQIVKNVIKTQISSGEQEDEDDPVEQVNKYIKQNLQNQDEKAWMKQMIQKVQKDKEKYKIKEQNKISDVKKASQSSKISLLQMALIPIKGVAIVSNSLFSLMFK